MRILAGIGLVAAGAVAAACGSGESRRAEPPPAETAAAVPGAADGGLIEGTPPGGLQDWLTDIEAGLSRVMPGLALAPADVQRAMVDLYVDRQEYLEWYWGPSGRLQGAGGAALGEAIMALETAFHELLQAMAAEPLDTSRVALATGATKARAEAVRATAAASGLVLVPPGNAEAGASRE